MPDHMTLADAIADGKRASRGRRQIIRNVLFAAFLLTLKLFTVPTVGHTARVLLALAIIALMIGAFFEWGIADQKLDEFQRDVARDAYSFVFRVMFHVLWFFFLLDIGFGLPLSINLPFGLAPLVVAWRDAAFLSLFTYVIANIVLLKRRSRG